MLKSLTTICLLAVFMSGCASYSGEDGSPVGSRMIPLGNGVCKDLRSGKMWQVGASRTIKSLEEAKEYTASLKVGGYDDWRLPTVTELFDLYMIFDLKQNGDCNLKVEGIYWSDEPDLQGRVGTWELDDNCDPERQYIPKTKGRVRAVRL
ncbi:MAG: DUF1566 domain-containing protein [Desulfobulbaceae bacterium]|nr:DUF1566 domain-containing protein [Desulfobulbaceae bacterium]